MIEINVRFSGNKSLTLI